MRRITLIRHGSTELNEERRYQGRTDAPLSDAGHREVRDLRNRVTRHGPRADEVWTSDLRRARRTAEAAFPGARLRVDARLRELDFGAFEGRTYARNVKRHGRRFERWIHDPARIVPPGGESLGALRERLRAWLEEVEFDREPVAVTHGGTIRMIVSLLTGLGFARLRSSAVERTSVLALRRDGDGWRPAPRREDAPSLQRRLEKEIDAADGRNPDSGEGTMTTRPPEDEP